MTTAEAIDRFVVDQRMAGRINSDTTERSYRSVLRRHMDDIDNRDPRTVGPSDIKRTLARWPKPNTQRVGRSILMAYYRWTCEEDIRPTNPVERTRRPKKQPTAVYRLTLSETKALLSCTETIHELRAIRIGICAGLRSAELRGLQGRHFRRPGFIWVSRDIGKGSRERWIPVIPELAAVWADIHRTVKDDEYVLCAQRWRDPGTNTIRGDLTKRPMSPQALYYLVGRMGHRAGIQAHISPHSLRHAHGDHIAKHAGLLIAQAMLGHADVSTTRNTYVGQVSLDDLSKAVQGMSFMEGLLPPDGTPPEALEAPTRIELVPSSSRSVAEDLGRVLVGLRAAFA